MLKLILPLKMTVFLVLNIQNNMNNASNLIRTYQMIGYFIDHKIVYHKKKNKNGNKCEMSKKSLK